MQRSTSDSDIWDEGGEVLCCDSATTVNRQVYATAVHSYSDEGLSAGIQDGVRHGLAIGFEVGRLLAAYSLGDFLQSHPPLSSPSATSASSENTAGKSSPTGHRSLPPTGLQSVSQAGANASSDSLFESRFQAFAQIAIDKAVLTLSIVQSS